MTRDELYHDVLEVLSTVCIARCMDDERDRTMTADLVADYLQRDLVAHPRHMEPTRRLMNEHKAMEDNLAATQHRSTQLLQALRAAYELANYGSVPPGVTGYEAERALVGAARAVMDGGDWKDPR